MLRSNMFAFINGDGNLIQYEKIEADDDNDGNNNDDVSSRSDRKVKADELQAMKSSVTT